jgi:beta-lactamase class A
MAAIAGLAVVVLLIIVQIIYPNDKLLPFATVDTIEVGGKDRQAVVEDLNKQLQAKTVQIYFGDNPTPYRTPSLQEIGMQGDNTGRIKDMNYPWYLRIMPGSLLWYGLVQDDGEPSYQPDEKALDAYIKKELGASCRVAAKDATLTLRETRLEVVSSRPGGTCDIADVRQALMETTPQGITDSEVRIAVKNVPARVDDDTARQLAEALNRRTEQGVSLAVAGSNQTIPAAMVLGWLDFRSDGSELIFSVDSKKANNYFKDNVTPKLTKAPGVTSITTLDFTETVKKVGANGRTLNVNATAVSIASFLRSESERAAAVPAAVAPRVDYTRRYTSTSIGLSALAAHYASDNPGTYGVSFQEIGGQGRSAQYGSENSFVTASTYKLFVALGTLTRVEDKSWKWSDQIQGGRDLTTCFDDMIVKSDNACAETLLKKIGYEALTDELHQIGLTDSGFMADRPRTTPADLTEFLIKLERGQLPINSTSRGKLLDAMKRNVYVAGIPSGTSSTVADKVGFLEALLHDAAIVYTPQGTYVLIIMTDGSTWGNIAELTRKIEALRVAGT